MNPSATDNIGSLTSIEIAHHHDFISWNPAILVPTKLWQRVDFSGEAELKRKTKDTPHGPIYMYSGYFDILKICNEVEKVLLKFIGRRAILRIEDSNSQVYLIGEPNNPISLDEESSTGKLPKAKNGYQFNFSVSQTRPALSN